MVLDYDDVGAMPRQLSEAVREREVGGVTIRTLESCHITWLFHPGRMRFRRIPRGDRVEVPSGSDWAPYYGLDIDLSTGRFAVGLNPDGTRLIRSWLHVEPCVYCGAGDRTGEISLRAPQP